MKNIISLYHRFDQLFGLILVDKAFSGNKNAYLLQVLFLYILVVTQKNCISKISVKRQSKGHTSEQIKEMQP